MPELPEVQTIVGDLKKHIVGSRIMEIRVLDGFTTNPPESNFIKKLTGKEITGVERIAKNIIITLDNEEYLLIHLAMTGRILWRRLNHKKDPWEKVIFTLEKDGKKGLLKYCDMRMFGKVKLLNKKQLAPVTGKYGPDPFGSLLTPENFLEKLQRKKTNIKNALLDQSLISGVGNIYANDALWMAKIHPEIKTKDLTPKQAGILLGKIKEILREGINNRGSTIRDRMYVDIYGRYGSQQKFFRIYDKKECPDCTSKVVFKRINGRGTFFCPKCQPANLKIQPQVGGRYPVCESSTAIGVCPKL